MINIFTDADEKARLLATCDAAGIDAPTSTELLQHVEEARCLDTMLSMFAQGRVRPYLDEDGELKWTLTDMARAELSEKFAAMALKQAGL